MTERDAPSKEVWLRHGLFAAAYAAAVAVFVLVSYTGTSIALAWPSVGIAVWWVVTCRSRWSFVLVSVFVVLLPTLYLGVVEDRSLLTTVPVGVAYFLAGPAVGTLMTVLERMHPNRLRDGDGRVVPRIVLPRHVYQLLIACFVLIPVAKIFSLLGIDNAGGDVSAALYVSLILRDLAGIFAVAGPGIAVSSNRGRAISPATVREFCGVVAVTAVVLLIIFGVAQELPIAYLAMLPLYWSATRLPVPVAAVHAVFTVGTVAALAYGVGAGPFAISDESSMAQASAIQLFIIMCVLLSLVVSTTVQQHSTLVAERDALTSTIPDALLLVDRDGRAIPINEAAQGVIVENSDGKTVARRLREINGELLNDATRPSGQVLAGASVHEMFVELAYPPEGGAEEGRRFYSISASPLYGPGEQEPGYALLLYHEVTNEYRSLQELRRAHQEARDLFEYAPQGIATLDAEGVILQANRALGELIDVSATDLPGRRLDEFSGSDDLVEEVNSALRTPGTLVHADRCFTAPNGHSRRVALSVRTMTSEDAAPAPLLVNAVDVTERQALHDLVSRLADEDGLTGLMNRRRFEAEFKKILERSVRELSDGAVLLIDLDNFKMVNDFLGHQAGDELLVEIAQVLKDCVRSTDMVARLGGDEFVIVLPDTGQTAATAIGRRIIDAVRERVKGRPTVLRRVTASVGIGMFSEAHEHGLDPLVLADQLLYQAKHAGRDRFAALSLGREVGQPPAVKGPGNRFEHILQTEAFTLELQPIVDVATGRVMMAEGLLRIDPAEGSVSTGELVTAVERAGLGAELDMRVFRQGIKILPELQCARPGFRLTLNLSAQSLGSERMCRLIVSELEKHRVPPGSLVIEVTESAAIEDLDAACSFQRVLQAHGVTFALDDFGAGVDPYRYLKQLDFEIVKIAGEFIEGMTVDGVNRDIVRSIVHLADSRGISTVAEFVSGEDVFDAVRQTGVTYGQGYYFGASLPPPDFVENHINNSWK